MDSQGKGQEVGADFSGVVTDLVGEASEQSMWLKHEGHKMKVNQESDYFWGESEQDTSGQKVTDFFWDRCDRKE